MTLRVGFAGTPAFAATTLAGIADAGFSVSLVVTRPDKPKGRGLTLEPSAVKVEALRRGIPLLEPPTLKTPEGRANALEVALDVLVVAAYGLILPPAVLAWPRHGCLNVHASLLPRWRGAAPIQRAIEAGDRSTGVTIMQMDAGLDTGPVVATREIAVAPRETAGTLHDKLAAAGTALVVEVLRRLAREGRLESSPQPRTGVSHAAKVERREARIDWSMPATAIDRRVRAFDPVPGAFTGLDAVELKVWRAEPMPGVGDLAPGTVVLASAEGIDVACGEGVLRIAELQPEGRRRMSARDFLAGRSVAPGTRLAIA